MVKFSKHILIQILFILCSFNFGYCLSIEGIWIPKKINWRSPDIEELKEMKYSSISILQFLADGTFKKFNFIVYLNDDGLINISIPEWGNIFIGQWEMRNNNEITVNYRLVDRLIEKSTLIGGKWVKEPLPGNIIKESFLLNATNQNIVNFYFRENNFIRGDKLSKKSVEFISNYKSKY